jgi:hypothetical protein
MGSGTGGREGSFMRARREGRATCVPSEKLSPEHVSILEKRETKCVESRQTKCMFALGSRLILASGCWAREAREGRGLRRGRVDEDIIERQGSSMRYDGLGH